LAVIQNKLIDSFRESANVYEANRNAMAHWNVSLIQEFTVQCFMLNSSRIHGWTIRAEERIGEKCDKLEKCKLSQNEECEFTIIRFI